MSAQILTIPDNADLWPAWLEDQLSRPGLPVLVAQLQFVLDRQPSNGQWNAGTGEAVSIPVDPTELLPELQRLLGVSLPDVCLAGLRRLDASKLRLLLQRPELLISLQEYVLLHGGEYWEKRLASAMGTSDHESRWQALVRALPSSPTRLAERRRPVATSWQACVTLMMGLAAVVLLAVTLWPHFTPSPTWGFQRIGLLTVQATPSVYLRTLADAAEDWFRERPESTGQLARRMREFADGCDQLIAASHAQLAVEDRQWLVERCQAWKVTINEVRRKLLTEDMPLDRAIQESDQTIRKLQEALRTRAKQVG